MKGRGGTRKESKVIQGHGGIGFKDESEWESSDGVCDEVDPDEEAGPKDEGGGGGGGGGNESDDDNDEGDVSREVEVVFFDKEGLNSGFLLGLDKVSKNDAFIFLLNPLLPSNFPWLSQDLENPFPSESK